MKIEFSTHEYLVSHGKQPRGTGTWLFRLHPNDGMSDWVEAYGTLTQAKKIAKERYTERFPMSNDYGCIEILP